MLLNCGSGEDSWESLDCKEIQQVHPKGEQSWVFIGRTDAEAETPILWPPDAKSWLIWKYPDAGKDWRQEEKRATEHEMVRWHHWLDRHEFEQALGISDGYGGLACCSPWGRKDSGTTEWLNNNNPDYSSSAIRAGPRLGAASRAVPPPQEGTGSAWRPRWFSQPGLTGITGTWWVQANRLLRTYSAQDSLTLPQGAFGDGSEEIKRCLLLGRKAMTNLDSVLKSIILLTKVCIVKASSEPGWWRPAWVARPIYVTCTEGAREQKPLGLNDIIRCSQWAAESQQRLGARLAHLCLLTTSSDKNPPVSAC